MQPNLATTLRDTGYLPCAKQSPVCTRQKSYGNQASAKAFFVVDFLSGIRQSLCRVHNSRLGKKMRRRQLTAAGPLCRVPAPRHTANKGGLPCAKYHSTRQRMEPLPCAMDLAHDKDVFQAGPWPFFAVCFGLCTRQRLEIFFGFFILSHIWYPNHFSNTYIYQSNHHTYFIQHNKHYRQFIQSSNVQM